MISLERLIFCVPQRFFFFFWSAIIVKNGKLLSIRSNLHHFHHTFFELRRGGMRSQNYRYITHYTAIRDRKFKDYIANFGFMRQPCSLDTYCVHNVANRHVHMRPQDLHILDVSANNGGTSKTRRNGRASETTRFVAVYQHLLLPPRDIYPLIFDLHQRKRIV